MEGEWVGGMTGEDWDAVAEIGAASPAGAFSPRFPESSAFPAVGMPATTTPATSALRRSAEAGSVAGARLAVQQPLRKSCEFCRFRKKKCDGDGVNKCSLCVSRGMAECVYSERLSSAPKNPSRSSKRSKQNEEMSSPPPTTKENGCNRAESQLVPLKRCRLSPSPATGLVGMQENVFLSDYFDCLGLLSLTSESNIRQAMVSVMLSALPPRQKVLYGSIRQPAIATTLGVGAQGAPAEKNSDASRCALWCAVALGALVQGWSTSSVMGYVGLAREALMGCFDDVSVDTLRAYTLMAYLHNFIGDEQKFQKYLMFAHGTARALPKEVVPADAVDVLQAADNAMLYSGVAPTAGEMETFCRLKEPDLTVDAIGGKSDMYRFLLQADHRFDQAFFRDMSDSGALHHDLAGPEELEPSLAEHTGATGPPERVFHAADEKDHVRANQEGFGSEETRQDHALREMGSWEAGGKGGGGQRDLPPSRSDRPGGGVTCGRVTLTLVEGTHPEPPPPGKTVLRVVTQYMPEMRRLVDGGKWPEMKKGAAGFLFNMRMGYLHGMRKEKAASRAFVARSVDMLMQYPGLCRFSSWRHVAHCGIGSLVKTGEREKYERVRKLYNEVRPTCSSPAPPFEEWSGIGDICQHIFCRSSFSKLWTTSPIVDTDAENSPSPRPEDELRGPSCEEQKLNPAAEASARPRLVPEDGCTSSGTNDCVVNGGSGGCGMGRVVGSTSSVASGESDSDDVTVHKDAMPRGGSCQYDVDLMGASVPAPDDSRPQEQPRQWREQQQQQQQQKGDGTVPTVHVHRHAATKRKAWPYVPSQPITVHNDAMPRGGSCQYDVDLMGASVPAPDGSRPQEQPRQWREQQQEQEQQQQQRGDGTVPAGHIHRHAATKRKAWPHVPSQVETLEFSEYSGSTGLTEEERNRPPGQSNAGAGMDDAAEWLLLEEALMGEGLIDEGILALADEGSDAIWAASEV